MIYQMDTTKLKHFQSSNHISIKSKGEISLEAIHDMIENIHTMNIEN